MPIIDVMLLVFALGEIVFAGYWGRILSAQKMQSPGSIKRAAIWTGAGAAILALADYGFVLAGHGSPISWLLFGKH